MKPIPSEADTLRLQELLPTQHQARCGRRRVFLSDNDARQYEAGWNQWPNPMPADVALSTPYSRGYFDREHEEEQREETAREAHDEHIARLDAR